MRCSDTSGLSTAESGRKCKQILEHKSNFVTHIPKQMLPPERWNKWRNKGVFGRTEEQKKEKRSAGDRAEENGRGQEQTATGHEGLCCHWLSGFGCFPTAPLQPEWQAGLCFYFVSSQNVFRWSDFWFENVYPSHVYLGLYRRIEKTERKVRTPSAVIRSLFK